MKSDMALLKDLISNQEDWLVRRLFHYAFEHNYAEGTAALEKAWRNCVKGLSGAIIKGIDTIYPDIEFGPDHDFRNDPLCSFIVDTAIRHRKRGVSLQMFQGLMTYYREAWLDLVRNAQFERENECLKIVNRMFDRFMIALCAEWSSTEESRLLEELQIRNREAIIEKNRFLTIFESLPNPVLSIDEHKNIINFNIEAAKMLNAFDVHGTQYYYQTAQTSNTIIGNPITHFLPWLVDDLDIFIAGNESSVSLEKKVINEKQARYFFVKLSRRFDVSKTFVGGVIILEDITDKIQAQEELRKAKEAAEAANTAKSIFLANMSHELRTPLNTILGYSQLIMRDSSLSEKHKGYLNTINRSGEYLLALLNDVLEISKIEARHIRLQETNFDLHTLIYDLEKMFRIKTHSKDIILNLVGIEKLPRYVKTDEKKLRQILINLLENAVKFTDQGFINLRTAANYGLFDKIRLVIEVEDTGMGIAAEEQGRLFECFEQTASGRQSQSGTGLGLAISREYARIMGGDITVSSQVGIGSTFYLEINVEPGKEPEHRGSIGKLRVLGLDPGKNDIPRVLVVEDQEESRKLLCRLLEITGFEIKEAANGAEALEIFKQWRPHFIWMDVRLPIMNGLEATRLIKTTKHGKLTKIVALSASAMEEDKEKILAAGFDGFVGKPYREENVFEIMAHHLGVKYLYQEAEDNDFQNHSAGFINSELLAAIQNSELGNELYESILRLDTHQTNKVIDKISARDPFIGKILRNHADKLDYGSLFELVENIV